MAPVLDQRRPVGPRQLALRPLRRLTLRPRTKERANRAARADVTVEGRTILADVPVTWLLFLEKRLTDLRTFVKKPPVLDAAGSWSPDPSTDRTRADGCEFGSRPHLCHGAAVRRRKTTASY
ncbi:DUF7873 family protein [Streptantibioticus silvisoli]|uniref:DUF7873 family protein n=1 Tax=Streptantibioticus silvisoli TaxID=2705255 RepID=UPI003FD88E98